MRWLTVLVLCVPLVAAAKPKVAVAPLDGDESGKISAVVADAADDHAKVTKPSKVQKAMDNLSVTALNGKTLKKLRINLEVDLVIYGSVEKDGKKTKLSLTIQGKGKNKTTVELESKSQKTLKKELSKALAKKFDNLLGGDEDPDDDDAQKLAEEKRKHEEEEKRKRDDDERERRKHDDDERERKKHADDDEREHKKKRVADDEGVRKKRSDDDDEGGGRKKRRKKRGEQEPRNPITQAAVTISAGGEVARRTLTWDANGGGPPMVGTAAGAGALSADIYPMAFDSLEGGAGFGFYADIGYTVGLSIAVPGTTVKAPIKDAHYLAGLRYRFAFGTSSLALGAGFWKRYYIADRGSLMMPGQLDMPDVDYTGIAPGVLGRVALTPTVGGFAQLDVPLVLSNGDIGSAKSYGRGTIIAFDIKAGVEILVGDHYAVVIAAMFDQVGMSFEAAQNSLAATRGVHGATDRSYGINAGIGILY